MACTGLRITEALTLGADDVDLEAGVLTVRQTKFRKSRLVPLHASAIGPLRDYAAARDGRHRQPRDTTFFVSDAGQRLPYTTVRHTFHRLLREGHAGSRPGRPRTAAPPRPAALRSRAAACWPGIATGRTSTGPSTSSRLTSATPRSPTPTGT